jgi:predicted nucleic acid-binding Zn ribbon protein
MTMVWRPLTGTDAPIRVGETLDRVLAGLGAPSRAGVEVVFDRWSEIVGASLATHSRPAAINGDVLVVACDEPAVATHVRFLEPQLLGRISELSGARQIARIEVRVGKRRRGPRPPRRG